MATTGATGFLRAVGAGFVALAGLAALAGFAFAFVALGAFSAVPSGAGDAALADFTDFDGLAEDALVGAAAVVDGSAGATSFLVLGFLAGMGTDMQE